MKNKFLSIILALCLIIPCAVMFTGCKDKDAKTTIDAWDGTVAEVSEAVDNVITIETAEEFAGFAKSVNEGNQYVGITVELAKDLDLQNRAWTPIGYGCMELGGVENEKAFRGTFDGKEHTIYNLNIDYSTTRLGGEATGSAGIGLFGQLLSGAIVKNLDVENAVVKGNHYVAVIAGYAYDNVLIDNCEVEDAQVVCTFKDEDDSGDKAGTIVGLLQTQSTVTNCEAEDSTVSAARDGGQLIGCIIYGSTQSGNIATNVTVTDNNSNNDNENDNIRNEIVGRVED